LLAAGVLITLLAQSVSLALQSFLNAGIDGAFPAAQTFVFVFLLAPFLHDGLHFASEQFHLSDQRRDGVVRCVTPNPQILGLLWGEVSSLQLIGGTDF
jgi:hypothetical protein